MIAPTIAEEVLDLWDSRLHLRIKTAGAGPPLFYFHPSAGLSWDPFLSYLAQSHTVYAPEFPGTSAIDPNAVDTFENFSDLLLAYEEMIRRLGATRPVFVGQSFGGLLAAELAAHFPDVPDKLVLLDPVGLWRDDAPVANWIATPLEDLPELLFANPHGPEARAMLEAPDDPDEAAAEAAALAWAFRCTGKFAWPIDDQGLRSRLHRIVASTLIIWGRDDRLVPASHSEDFARLIRNSTVYVIDECGHIPQVEQFDKTVAAVDRFLRTNVTEREGVI